MPTLTPQTTPGLIGSPMAVPTSRRRGRRVQWPDPRRLARLSVASEALQAWQMALLGAAGQAWY